MLLYLGNFQLIVHMYITSRTFYLELLAVSAMYVPDFGKYDRYRSTYSYEYSPMLYR